MNWITVAWPMVAGACLTLGLIQLRVGLGQTPRAPRLLFALSAFAVANVAGLELALMQADTLAEWWPVMRALDVAVGVMLVSLAGFIWAYFGTGTKWLAGLVPVLYGAGLMFDYFSQGGMTYDKVTGFRTVKTFGGVTFNVAEGVPNPWNVLPYLAVLTLIVFVADASVRLWRRGGRRRASVVGGAVVFFLLAAGGHSALLEAGMVETPYVISWCYLAILLAMASELNADVVAVARLSRSLTESESRMQLASEAAKLGMWTWDVAHDSVWATDRARALFGFSASEPLSLARVLGTSHVEDRAALEHAIRKAVAGKSELELEHRVADPDGAVRWVALRGKAENGGGVRLLGVVIDITERKVAALQAAKDRLALQHMTRVSQLGQLSASIAHQLNQPLAAILGNAEAAQKMLGRENVDLVELRDICNDIVSEDLRASQVIQHLRDLFKRGEPKVEPINLNQVAVKTLDLVRNELLNRQIAVDTQLASTPPAIKGDAVQLQQVVLNLLLNGAEAMSTTVKEKRILQIRTEADATHVRLCVVDQGPGIDVADLKRVFDAFWTSKPGGMGMGLALCESIVVAHHGSIAAANNAGGGATFCVTLPICRHA
jgi:two-component system, LuxR family, sensor kinase FixL